MAEIVSIRAVDDRNTKFNVLGDVIEECSCDPMTGWFRDGTCSTDDTDQGHHVVCCVMTEEFLEFSAAAGNDLSKPRHEFGFPGLKPGDHWCLCALRWKEALLNNMAPRVVLESTHQSALAVVTIDELKRHAAQ